MGEKCVEDECSTTQERNTRREKNKHVSDETLPHAHTHTHTHTQVVSSDRCENDAPI